MFTYPMFTGAGTALAVKSIELVEVASIGTNSIVNLTKGQDYTQCVPFLTMHGTSQDNSERMDEQAVRADVIDNAGTAALNLVRGASSLGLAAKCYVVEFNTGVGIQKFNISNPGGVGNNTVTQAITTVVTAKTFVLGTFSGTAGTNLNMYKKLVETKLDSASQISVNTAITPISISPYTATVFVVEDIDGTLFNVQSFGGSATGSGNTDHAITSVGTSTSSILFSHCTDATGTSDHYDSAVKAHLLNGTTVRVNHPSATAEARRWTGYVITWLDGSTVQRGLFSQASGTTSQLATVSPAITAVDTTMSIAYLTHRHFDAVALANGTSYNAIECKFSAKLASGGASVELRYWKTVFNDTEEFAWEVIEFAQ